MQEKNNSSISIEALDRITSYQNYEQEEITLIGNYLATNNKYKYITRNHFFVVDSSDQLINSLKNHNQALSFFIYKNNEGYWVTFCMIKDKKGFNVLYKDFYNRSVSKDIKNAFTIFSNINFITFNNNKEIDDYKKANESGVVALRNMQIMMDLVPLNKGTEFINHQFLKSFCYQSSNSILILKTKYKLALIGSDINRCINSIDSMIIDTEDLSQIKKLIHNTVNVVSKIGVLVTDYRNLLMDENKKHENTPEYKIDKSVLRDTQEKMIETLKNFKNYHQVQEGGNSLTLESNEGEQYNSDALQELIKIFSLLKGVEIIPAVSKILKKLSKVLSLEEKLLQQFLFAQKLDVTECDESKQKHLIAPIKLMNTDELEQVIPKQNINFSQDEFNVKPLDKLLSEVMLTQEEEILRDLTNQKVHGLKQQFAKIKQDCEYWKDQGIQKIREWVDEYNNHDKIDVFTAIAVMNRANEIATGGHQLRDTQILSILMLLTTDDNKGKLFQIGTGEGKTTIVSLFAALKVIQGKQVDIITSNQVLAAQGVEDREKFYNILNISCTTNNINQRNPEVNERQCYKSDIVYGTIANFQFDYLKDSFENYGTRAGRKFDCVILDEVDSMIIDNGGNVAKLSTTFPGMDNLKYLYIKIWEELHKAQQSIPDEIKKKLEERAVELSKKVNISEQDKQSEYENYRSTLCQNITEQIKEKIKNSPLTDIDLIPVHLTNYVNNMLDKWIDNALYAMYQCHEDQQYTIKKKDNEDVIVPVDYLNTGVTLKNTMWSNGLHQFIQLKHNLQLTSESLIGSFISNIGYIKLYNNNIFGLTGTLGSETERELLFRIYNVNFTKIPTYKSKCFNEYGGIVVKDKSWINTVVLSSFMIARSGRSVLIICKTIKDLYDIEKNIIALKNLENCHTIKIKTFVDEEGKEILNDQVDTSEIIISTNIAGRGVDFRTSVALENKGGLHVCISFLPCNQRVEEQAFGRTSRQGKSGTGQLIITQQDLQELNIEIQPGMTFASIKEKRDDCEKSRLLNIQTSQLAEIIFLDKLFNKFSALYRDFKKEQVKISGGIYVTNDLKEYWAFWLHSQNYTASNIKAKNVEQEFERFTKDAKVILGMFNGNKYISGKIHHNPYYYIQQAECFLKDNQVGQAKNALEQAILLSNDNGKLLHSAHMKLFEIAIREGGQMMERFKKALGKIIFISVNKDEKYLEEAKKHLDKAQKALTKERDYIQQYWNKDNKDFINIVNKSTDNSLIKHLKARMLILDFFFNQAKSLMQQIDDISEDKTEGLVINSRIPDYFRNIDNSYSKNEQALKNVITNDALAELRHAGLNTIYALKQVHDVPDKIIERAQIQILFGIDAIVWGLAFPPILPVMSPIAGTLISEGICDIAIELISQGNAEFSEKAYIKGKCISYGISVVTMGIGALASCTKILNKAIQACQGLARILRSSPYLINICEILAVGLEKLSQYFVHLKHVAELRHIMSLSQRYTISSVSKMLVKETIQSVVGSIFIEKVVTKGLDEILSGFKSILQKDIEQIVSSTITSDKIKYLDQKYVNELLSEILVESNADIVKDVLKSIALGALRHSSNWKAKFISLGLDACLSYQKQNLLMKDTENLCKKLNDSLNTTQIKNKETSNSNAYVQKILQSVIIQITEQRYQILVEIAGKFTHTVVINPLMQKIWTKIWGEDNTTNFAKDEDNTTNFVELNNAYMVLGLEVGATLEEVQQAYRRLVRNMHPDRNDQPDATERFQELNNANILLRNHLSRVPDNHINQETHRNDTPTNQVVFEVEPPTSNEPANVFNIQSLSNNLQICIIVKSKNKPDIVIGSEYKNKNNISPYVVDYSPPTQNSLGHYQPTIVDLARIKSTGAEVFLTPSGHNNCFYDTMHLLLKHSKHQTIAPEVLRRIAEKRNLNLPDMHALSRSRSRRLTHPITQQIYRDIQGNFLVGGGSYFSVPQNNITSEDLVLTPIESNKVLLHNTNEHRILTEVLLPTQSLGDLAMNPTSLPVNFLSLSKGSQFSLAKLLSSKDHPKITNEIIYKELFRSYMIDKVKFSDPNKELHKALLSKGTSIVSLQYMKDTKTNIIEIRTCLKTDNRVSAYICPFLTQDTIDFTKLKTNSVTIPFFPNDSEPKIMLTGTFTGCSLILSIGVNNIIVYHDAKPTNKIVEKMKEFKKGERKYLGLMKGV